ncbi:MAG: hypothetical protein IKA36_02960 [Clostridia bacterium]|nr:hypothetical protein [Clostridia bacterium]
MIFDIKKVKIFVMVPNKNVEQLINSVCDAGAGVIGNYTHCTFSTKGKGSFVPNNEASPYIGKINKLEIVDEMKVEFVCDVNNVKNVLNTIRKVHPYEEPGIDIIPLLDESNF